MTAPNNTQAPVTAYMVIDGKHLPIWEFTVTMGAYGTVGTFSATTDIEALNTAKIDLYVESLATKKPFLPVQIYVSDQYGNTNYLLFGGEYDRSEWEMLEDTVTLTGRDWAGILVDTKVTLQDQSMYFNTQASNSVPTLNLGDLDFTVNNLTIYQFYEKVASIFGFTLDINQAELWPKPLGVQVQEYHVFSGSPKPLWDIMVFLARIGGVSEPLEVFITPDKVIHLQPVSTTETLNVSWKLPSSQISKGTFPLMNLRITHEPRRNATFAVVVLSYHYAAVHSQWAGIMYANTENFNKNQANYQKYDVGGPGWTVGQGPWASGNLMNDLGKPVYVFREKQGMNKSTAYQQAFAMVADLAKREIIIEGTIDGYAPLLPMTKITLTGKSLMGFEVRTYYANTVEHHFSLPDETGDNDSGFTTHFKAWTLPLAQTNAGLSATQA